MLGTPRRAARARAARVVGLGRGASQMGRGLGGREVTNEVSVCCVERGMVQRLLPQPSPRCASGADACPGWCEAAGRNCLLRTSAAGACHIMQRDSLRPASASRPACQSPAFDSAAYNRRVAEAACAGCKGVACKVSCRQRRTVTAIRSYIHSSCGGQSVKEANREPGARRRIRSMHPKHVPSHRCVKYEWNAILCSVTMMSPMSASGHSGTTAARNALYSAASSSGLSPSMPYLSFH